MRFHADLNLDDKAVDAIIERVQQAAEETIATEITKLHERLREQKPARPSLPLPVPQGVDLPQAERVKAADLRTAILLGKIPEDTGMLTDVKTTAKLLNVSERMVYRLTWDIDRRNVAHAWVTSPERRPGSKGLLAIQPLHGVIRAS